MFRICCRAAMAFFFFFFFQAEDGIRDLYVTEFRRVLFRSIREKGRCPSAVLKHSYTSRREELSRPRRRENPARRLWEMHSPPAAGITAIHDTRQEIGRAHV